MDTLYKSFDEMKTRLSGSHLLAKPLQIMTTTLTLRTDQDSFDIGEMSKIAMAMENEQKSAMKPVKHRKNAKTEKPWSSFFKNCVIFKLRSSTTKKVAFKFFKNGSIHITGAKDLRESIRLMETITGPSFVIKSAKINMVNATFRFPKHVDLMTAAKLMTHENRYVSYDKGQHCAMNVKFADRDGTILMFSTGTVSLVGGKSIDDVVFMYHYAQKFYHSHPEITTDECDEVKVSRKRGRRSKAEEDSFILSVLS